MTRINGKCNRCKCIIRSLFDNDGFYHYDLDETVSYFKNNDGLCNVCLTHMNTLATDELDTLRLKNEKTVRKKLLKNLRIMKCTQEIHYCKADKKTGKPVVVTNMANGSTKNVKKWKLDLFDKDGYPVRVEVEFGNSSGKAKNSGATTVLRVLENSWD
mgnify:FL=1